MLSADGRSLAISSGCNESKVPRIWVLPIGGGWPKIITERYPSRVYGWSPDGTTLAFRALRNGTFNIYVIALRERAEEVALTEGSDQCDGPEYSPDGRHLWFHSWRSGPAQLWRMKADGTQQTQITFDDGGSSCFPHVSPDGKQVVFFHYRREGTALDAHSMSEKGEIRSIGIESGKTMSLIESMGEGSMEVNSSSPDSKEVRLRDL